MKTDQVWKKKSPAAIPFAAKLLRKIARHSRGRQILASVGPRYIEVSLENFDMRLDLKDKWGVSKYILKYGDYDPDLCAVAERLIKPGGRCLDVGANIGFWSCFLARRCRAEKVYSFEPEPSNVVLLKENIELNGLNKNVEVFPIAVGAETSQLDLYLSADNAGDHQIYKTDEKRKSVKVDVRKIDDVMDQVAPSSQIDFIKMDVQGFEPFVVDGMLRLIERSPELVLLTEYWPEGMKRAGATPVKMLEKFQSLGFRFFVYDEASRSLKGLELDAVQKNILGDHHIDLFISRRAL